MRRIQISKRKAFLLLSLLLSNDVYSGIATTSVHAETVASSFTITNGTITDTNGKLEAKATVTPMVSNYSGSIVVVFQLMNGAVPLGIKSVPLSDNTQVNNVSAIFDTVGKPNYKVKIFLRDRLAGSGNVGTSLAEAITVNWMPNEAPTASNATISGTAQVGKTVTASYTYSDAENDVEGTSEFQWYQASQADGSDKQAISGATSKTYTIQAGDEGKYLFVNVTPKANTGTTSGTAVTSGGSSAVAPAFNEAPIVSSVKVSGMAQIGSSLTASYTYSDAENDAEGTSGFQWYRASQKDGSDKEAITGATSKTYTIQAADQEKYLFVEVTPKASVGTETGTIVLSTPARLVYQPGAFFSEYLDAGEGRSALEVYCRSDDSSGMVTGYKIKIYNYADETGSYITEVEPLPFYPDMPYIVINAEFYDFFDVSAASYFNEEAILNATGVRTYAVVLEKDGKIIDVIGNPNSSTYESILPDGGTIIRKSGIHAGSPEFYMDDDWDKYSKGTFTFVGRHQP